MLVLMVSRTLWVARWCRLQWWCSGTSSAGLHGTSRRRRGTPGGVMDPLPNPGIAYTTNSLFPISAMITNDIPMKKSDNEKTEDIIHTLCIESWCHYPLHSGFPDHLQDTITDFVNTLPVEERSQCLKVRLELNDVLREFVTDGNRPYTSEKQQELFGRLNVIYEELPNEVYNTS